MLLTIERTVKEQIEVEGEFPLYRKDGGAFYMLLSEEEYVEVYTKTNYWGASIVNLKNGEIVGAVLKKGEVISEKQFLDAYAKAFHDLQTIVGQPAQPEMQKENKAA